MLTPSKKMIPQLSTTTRALKTRPTESSCVSQSSILKLFLKEGLALVFLWTISDEPATAEDEDVETRGSDISFCVCITCGYSQKSRYSGLEYDI